MGKKFFDGYSLLHFFVGGIFYYWNISFYTSIILHIVFEIVENTQYGIYFINEYIKLWPGGKPFSDSLINSIGDTFFFILGYLFSREIIKIIGKY